MIHIKGKAKYVNLEMGFWGIEAMNGKKYMPINMPEQLKTNGATVECKAVVVEMDTFTQWGEVVKIISFETPAP